MKSHAQTDAETKSAEAKAPGRQTDGSTPKQPSGGSPVLHAPFPRGSGLAAHAQTLSRLSAGAPSSVGPFLLGLQQRHGNRYVQRVVTEARQAKDEVAPEVQSAIEGARGGGQPLPNDVRLPMEAAFQADFTGVRVHADERADLLNGAVDAVAFTTGQDVFFRQGAYAPGASAGRELLAHELTHVVQQQGGGAGVGGPLKLGEPKDAYEHEADRAAKAVGSTPGDSLLTAGPPFIASPPVQRRCACGGSTAAGEECDECRQAREAAVQRAGLEPGAALPLPQPLSKLVSPGLQRRVVCPPGVDPKEGTGCYETDEPESGTTASATSSEAPPEGVYGPPPASQAEASPNAPPAEAAALGAGMVGPLINPVEPGVPPGGVPEGPIEWPSIPETPFNPVVGEGVETVATLTEAAEVAEVAEVAAPWLTVPVVGEIVLAAAAGALVGYGIYKGVEWLLSDDNHPVRPLTPAERQQATGSAPLEPATLPGPEGQNTEPATEPAPGEPLFTPAAPGPEAGIDPVTGERLYTPAQQDYDPAEAASKRREKKGSDEDEADGGGGGGFDPRQPVESQHRRRETRERGRQQQEIDIGKVKAKLPSLIKRLAEIEDKLYDPELSERDRRKLLKEQEEIRGSIAIIDSMEKAKQNADKERNTNVERPEPSSSEEEEGTEEE